MKALLLIPASLALVATGVAVGFGLAGGRPDSEPAAPASEGEVVFRNTFGEVRVLTPTEAAGKIEQLERDAAAARRRSRSEPAEEETAAAPEPSGDPPAARFLRSDGKPYSDVELRELALNSSDVVMRTAAIRELRRSDTDQARETLQTVLADPKAPATIREEAAKALAQPPHRDKLPEELVTALRAESDPAVRRALAAGVGRMRDREAWMGDIAGMVHDEKDPEVRKFLFEAVLRDVRDPLARAELVGVAGDKSASMDERRAALAALRGRGEPEALAIAGSLLDDADARIRENAVAIVGSAKTISMSALQTALSDPDPGVRRAALETGAQRLPQFANDKTIPKADYQALVTAAVNLASTDPEAAVRRAALQQVWTLPKDVRESVLATGREDRDLFVKLTAYARSPDPVARQGAPYFVTGLDSADANVRDFAYRQLQRVSGVTAPFDARWNAKARAAAIAKIRQDLSTSGR